MTDERILSKPETDSCTVSVAGLLYEEDHTQGRKQVAFNHTSVVEGVIYNNISQQILILWF